MRDRIYLMISLTLACLALTGCGVSGAGNEQLPPITPADVAAAQVDIDRANEAEKAQGGTVPPSVRRKAKGSVASEESNSRSLSGGR